MTEDEKRDRPSLPRDAFRTQRVVPASTQEAPPPVVTPDYDDMRADVALTSRRTLQPRPKTAKVSPERTSSGTADEQDGSRNPFEVYGERTSSRPYALRLPDPIDFVLRQLAAEERTQPLRIIDRILYDHLKRIGRLPPSGGS